MAFFEQEFPTAAAFLAIGGPTFFTTVNEGFGGEEQANRNWSLSRGEWKIDLNHKQQAYFDAVQAFFLCVGGRADAFRFKDHKDFRVVNQEIGVGDGVTTNFQLIRTYVSGTRTYTRTISKPITDEVTDFQGNPLADTVKIYVDGTLQTMGTAYTLDYTTGLVTFLGGHIPVGSPPAIITADFEYHYPVRFLNDALQAQIEVSPVMKGNSSGSDPLITWPQIQLREVKNF